MVESSTFVALVVEDEPLILMETVDLLEDAGFTVLEAWNADSALSQLEQHGPVQLLFTDVQMPGSIDGIALAHEVKRRWPEAAVVVCSGNLKVDPEALPEGALFIDKPFTSTLVLETVRRLVHS
jgi:CheY-like chemotaxis protein